MNSMIPGWSEETGRMAPVWPQLTIQCRVTMLEEKIARKYYGVILAA
jgi:hypothetical protein